MHELNPCRQPISCDNPDQTLLSVSLRWICSLESSCLTSSCLETASQTSLKSSERGKLKLTQKYINTHTHTHSHRTHTPYSTIHSILGGNRWQICCIRYILPSVRHKLGETTFSRQLTRAAFRGLWTHTYLCTCASGKQWSKKYNSILATKWQDICYVALWNLSALQFQFPSIYLSFMWHRWIR